MFRKNKKKEPVSKKGNTWIKGKKVLKQPEYGNVDTIILQIKEDLQTMEYQIAKLRDNVSGGPGISKEKFNKLKEDYIKTLKQKYIYEQYRDKVNSVEDKKQEILILTAQKREIRTNLLKLSQQIKMTGDLDKKDKLIREYLRINKINNLDEKIRELNEEPHISTIILSLTDKTKIKQEKVEILPPPVVVEEPKEEFKDIKPAKTSKNTKKKLHPYANFFVKKNPKSEILENGSKITITKKYDRLNFVNYKGTILNYDPDMKEYVIELSETNKGNKVENKRVVLIGADSVKLN